MQKCELGFAPSSLPHSSFGKQAAVEFAKESEIVLAS
jgi:hypothetical protein